MKKTLIFLILSSLIISCSGYQKLLKSTDYELKYKKAMEYYHKGDYTRSSTLLNELLGVFRGTDKAENITYTYANCLYGMKDYMNAGQLYRSFAKTYPASELNEDCQFMSAYCYYMMSPKVRLDQTDTKNAIEEFKLFINLFPNSEYKSYLAAKLYFDLGNYMGNNYKSAVIAAKNSLKEFPDTKYREELSFLILEAKYIQAVYSIDSKKEERLRETIDEYYSFINEFPKSKYNKKAVKIFEHSSEAIKNGDIKDKKIKEIIE